MVVITGLDPVIHAFSALTEVASSAWMAGSSPRLSGLANSIAMIANCLHFRSRHHRA